MPDNRQRILNQICNRTSKILGGYVSETLFLEKFVIPANLTYSKGWWAANEHRAGNQPGEIVFFAVKNTLSEFDRRIGGLLLQHNYSWYQIKESNGSPVVIADGRELSFEQFAAERNLERSAHAARSTGDDPERERCISFFDEHNLTREIAYSIYVEDNFLNQFFYTTNIDLFIESPNNVPVCIELKFKDEFSCRNKLVFGEDKMQYETLFPILMECGMDVYNCILYNDIKNAHNTSTTNIFDFLDRKGENGKMFWKKKRFVNFNHEQYQFRQAHTNFWGAAGRTVYCIPLSEYESISEDGFFENTNDRSWKICSRCGGNMVLRARRSDGAEFFGYLNYRNH